MEVDEELFKNVVLKLTKQQETLELLYKGWQDFNINLLKQNIKGEDMPTKLQHGHLRFRNDLNLYEVILTLNKTRKSVYCKNKNECIKKANKIYNEETKKLAFKTEQKKYLHELLDLWLEKYKIPALSPNSIPTIKSALNKHIKKGLKNKPINSITILEIDYFMDSLKNSRAKETVSVILNDFFKWAFNKEILKRQIHDKFKKYKHTRSEGQFLTKEQRTIFLSNVEKIKSKDLFKFIYFTGCRKHGAFNLCYEDFNLDENTIHIKETKTKESDRFIPLNINIKYLANKDKTGKVFNISDRQLKSDINTLEMLCGFRVKLKDLRTTFATICREKGINEEVVAKWLGHSNSSTTKKYYIKVDPTFERKQFKYLNTKNMV